MPYIKPEFRPAFDEVVKTAQKGTVADALLDALTLISTKQDSELDGCLNYLFTQLLRKLKNLDDAYVIILNVLYSVFKVNTEPRYAKLQRVIGLLVCMNWEFHRRKWKPLALLKINDLIEYMATIISAYEDKKIAESGDIDITWDDDKYRKFLIESRPNLPPPKPSYRKTNKNSIRP